MKNFKGICFLTFLLVLAGVSMIRMNPTQHTDFVGDAGEFYRDVFDRPTLADMFSYSKLTNANGKTTYYSPAVTMIFNKAYHLSGGDIRKLTVFNQSIFAASAVLLFFLLIPFARSKEIAFVAALWFLFHKPNIGTARFLGAIPHVYALFFILLSGICGYWAIKKRNIMTHMLSALFCLLAYLCYPVAYGMPLIMALLWYAVAKTNKESYLKDALIWIAPYILLILPLVVVQILKYPMGRVEQSWGGMAVGLYSLIRQLDLLSWMIVSETVSYEKRELWLIGVHFLLFGGAAWALLKDRRDVLFFLAWITGFLALMCVSNFRPAVEVLRYHYVPSVGFAGLLTLILSAGQYRVEKLCKRSEIT